MVRRRIGIVIVFVMLLSVFGLAGCKEAPKKGIERIEGIIDVSLPEGAEVEYHYYSRSYDGSYTQITMLKLQESPDDFLSNYPLVQATESWGYDYFVRFLKGQLIKEKHIPSFDELLMSNKTKFSSGQGFTVVYFPSTLQLVFFIVHVD